MKPTWCARNWIISTGYTLTPGSSRSHPIAATLSEQVGGMATLRAYIGAHVLDDTEHGHLHLLEHLEALARIQQGNVLWRSYNNSTTYRYFLCQG